MGGAESFPVDPQEEKMNKRRQNIVEEILSTEKSYVESLQTLQQIFLEPLLEQSGIDPSKKRTLSGSSIKSTTSIDTTASTPPSSSSSSRFSYKQSSKKKSSSDDGILPVGDIKSIFSIINTILQFHQNELLPSITKRVSVWTADSMIGDVFSNASSVDFLRTYSRYCNNFDVAMATLDRCRASNDAFGQFLRTQESNPRCTGLTLESFLLAPVQRIPRYVLLLKDLYSHTPNFHDDYMTIGTALEEMQGLASYINEMKRNEEFTQVLLQLQNNIIGYEGDPIIQPHRRLVRHGELLVARGSVREGPSSKHRRRESRWDSRFIRLTKTDLFYGTNSKDCAKSLGRFHRALKGTAEENNISPGTECIIAASVWTPPPDEDGSKVSTLNGVKDVVKLTVSVADDNGHVPVQPSTVNVVEDGPPRSSKLDVSPLLSRVSFGMWPTGVPVVADEAVETSRSASGVVANMSPLLTRMSFGMWASTPTATDPSPTPETPTEDLEVSSSSPSPKKNSVFNKGKSIRGKVIGEKVGKSTDLTSVAESESSDAFDEFRYLGFRNCEEAKCWASAIQRCINPSIRNLSLEKANVGYTGRTLPLPPQDLSWQALDVFLFTDLLIATEKTKGRRDKLVIITKLEHETALAELCAGATNVPPSLRIDTRDTILYARQVKTSTKDDGIQWYEAVDGVIKSLALKARIQAKAVALKGKEESEAQCRVM